MCKRFKALLTGALLLTGSAVLADIGEDEWDPLGVTVNESSVLVSVTNGGSQTQTGFVQVTAAIGGSAPARQVQSITLGAGASGQLAFQFGGTITPGTVETIIDDSEPVGGK